MDENTLLKNEIHRLNIIISVLVNEVEALRSQNTMLKNSHNQSDEKDTIVKNEYGISISQNPIHENDMGINSSRYTIVDNQTGVSITGNTIVENEYGINTVGNAIRKNDIGINTEKSAIPKFSLPQIERTSDNLTFLKAALRKYLPLRTHMDRIQSTARQLLLLHNMGEASANDLRKIGKYSKGGFAKHLPKLKREGFIRKAAHGNYALTEKSKEILYEVFAERLQKKD
jgi:DNA-binding MarR family transcriptional regulator